MISSFSSESLAFGGWWVFFTLVVFSQQKRCYRISTYHLPRKSSPPGSLPLIHFQIHPCEANTISSHSFSNRSQLFVDERDIIQRDHFIWCPELFTMKTGTALQTLHRFIPTDQSCAFLKITAHAKNRLKGTNVGTDPNMGDSFSYLILSWLYVVKIASTYTALLASSFFLKLILW